MSILSTLFEPFVRCRLVCVAALAVSLNVAAVEPVKLSGTLASSNPALSPVLLSGLSYGAFIAYDSAASGSPALFRVTNTAIPGTPLRLSGSSVVRVQGFRVAPNGFNIAFLAQNAQWQVLYASNMGGSTLDIGGIPPRISGGTQWVDGFRISPDSTRVAFIAKQDASVLNSPYNLYSAPINGGSPTLLATGNAAMFSGNSDFTGIGREFEFTPDSSRVVFRSNALVANRMELYSVLADGSASPTRLSAAPAFGSTHQVQDFKISPNGARVVYRSDVGSLGFPQLYSVSPAGGAIAALPATAVAGSQVYPGYQISANSARVVYETNLQGATKRDLYSIPIAGGTATRLTFDGSILGSILGGNTISQFEISPDSARVVYISNKTLSSNRLLASTSITGGTTWQLGTFWGDVQFFRISPDASRVVFTGIETGAPASGRPFLWSVPTIGGALTVLSGPDTFNAYPTAAFLIAPNSQRVVFAADKRGTLTTLGYPTNELFSTPLAGGLTTLISGALVPQGSLELILGIPDYTFAIGPDSKRVVFVARKDTTAYTQLWGAPIDGGGALLDVDGDKRVLGTTDALMIMRRELGLPTTSVITGTVATTAQRTSAAALGNYLDALLAAEGGLLLDIDGNGRVDAITDLVYLLRYTLGFRGNALTAGVLGVTPAPTRDSAAIEDYLDRLMERSALLGDLVVF
jgi:Tol biopolymer transport system component